MEILRVDIEDTGQADWWSLDNAVVVRDCQTVSESIIKSMKVNKTFYLNIPDCLTCALYIYLPLWSVRPTLSFRLGEEGGLSSLVEFAASGRLGKQQIRPRSTQNLRILLRSFNRGQNSPNKHGGKFQI